MHNGQQLQCETFIFVLKKHKKLPVPYLRSKLSQENLNSFAVLAIECGIAKYLDYDEIINQFADRKSCMKTL